jgi:predicted ATPase/DNA-binding SARP family transcriptional activator
MQFQILGELRILRAEAPVAVSGRMALKLLAALLVESPRAVDRGRLVERLWGDHPPATATTALQVHVSHLRRELEPECEGGDSSVVRTTGDGYALAIDRARIDGDHFESLVCEAGELVGAEPERALANVESARALWRGRPWGAFGDEPWLRADVARLEELHRRADELWADAQLALGRHELIVDALARAVEDEPLRERRCEQLMTALYRCGRQAEALRAFQGARRSLTEELGIEPSPALRALEQAVLVQDPRLDAPPRTEQGRPRHNLPAALTSLVGRDDEVAATRKFLEASRLVTITGTAGCGKTGLALAVGEGLVDRYDDGVWFVDLTAAASTDVVATQIATDLGLRESDAHGSQGPVALLRTYLRDRELLLVLDNCEHVVAEVATVIGSLLTSCPGLRVLATSRVVIGVVGEAVEPLTPLETPAADATLDELASSPAVELFLQRSGDVGAPYARGAEQLPAVGELCRFLDGVPLAIELAATWTATLAPAEILQRLASRLSLVSNDDRLPERQRALRTTIDWSHTLLAETERVAFRQLSVYPAGFTLAGAAAVITGDPSAGDSVTGTIARLMSSSLVRTDHSSAPARYRMLEAIREYAGEQLRDSGEEDETRSRQLEYFVGLARNVRRDEFFGPAVPETMTALDGELDNVREALERLIVSRDGEHAALLAGAMGTYWFERGYIAEGQRWLARAIELTVGSRSLERGLALVALAETVSHFPAMGRRLPELQEAIEIVRGQGTERQLLYALTYLGLAYGMRGNRSGAAAVGAEQKKIRARLDDRWLDTSACMVESLGLVMAGNPVEARVGLRRCASAFLELGDETFAARVLMMSGIVSHLIGDLAAARCDLSQSADLARKAGVRGTQAHAQLTLAQVILDLGDPEAESLFRDCQTIFEMIGDTRCVGVCKRSLGSLALDDDRLDEAAEWLRQSVEVLASTDRPALAVAIADVATIYQRRGDTDDAVRLAAAAQTLAQEPADDIGLSAGERARIDAAVTATEADLHTNSAARVAGEGPVDLDAILEIARKH